MEFSLELSKFYVWAKYLFCRIEQYSNAVLYYRCCNSKCNVNIKLKINRGLDIVFKHQCTFISMNCTANVIAIAVPKEARRYI